MKQKPKIIQVLGTSSSSGKTSIALSLCRHLSDIGFHVAPFKSVNMSLNSIAIDKGREISRSVWLQAMAARSDPEYQMNPVLLKPEGEGKSQVIVDGMSRGVMTIDEYHRFMMNELPGIIKRDLDHLIENYDVVIAEGAGSTAEINLQDWDYANIKISSLYDTPAILVSDIERGGSFASIYGTLKLMLRSDLVRWIIINKMRGDASLLLGGIEKIEELTGKKFIGVVPFLDGIILPGEDSLDYHFRGEHHSRVAVIRYPHMENYSDVDPLRFAGIPFTFVDERNSFSIENADIIILPGSKNVPADLDYLRRSGLDEKIIASAHKGKRILGICGGYQILGRDITLFGKGREQTLKGLSLLKISTTYEDKKTVGRLIGSFMPASTGISSPVSGYEIHYGKIRENAELPLILLNGEDGEVSEGAVSSNRRIIGTNLHGILENRDFLEWFLNVSRESGWFYRVIEENIKKVTEHFIGHLETEEILTYLEKT